MTDKIEDITPGSSQHRRGVEVTGTGASFRGLSAKAVSETLQELLRENPNMSFDEALRRIKERQAQSSESSEGGNTDASSSK